MTAEKGQGSFNTPLPQIIDKVDDLQTFKKTARQGDKPVNEGVYSDVNDRNFQAQSTTGFFDGLGQGSFNTPLPAFCLQQSV